MDKNMNALADPIKGRFCHQQLHNFHAIPLFFQPMIFFSNDHKILQLSKSINDKRSEGAKETKKKYLSSDRKGLSPNMRNRAE